MSSLQRFVAVDQDGRVVNSVSMSNFLFASEHS